MAETEHKTVQFVFDEPSRYKGNELSAHLGFDFWQMHPYDDTNSHKKLGDICSCRVPSLIDMVVTGMQIDIYYGCTASLVYRNLPDKDVNWPPHKFDVTFQEEHH